MKATVAEKREVAKGTLLVLFAVDDYPAYRPGHYFWVELPDRGHQDEKGLPPPHLARHLADRGRVSSGLRRGSATRRSSARSPSSRSGTRSTWRSRRARSSCPRTRSVDYVFIAGGIGITVFRSMLRYIAGQGAALPRDARLLESRPRVGGLPRRARRCSNSESTGLRVILTMTEEEGWEGRRASSTPTSCASCSAAWRTGSSSSPDQPADGRGRVRVAPGCGPHREAGLDRRLQRLLSNRSNPPAPAGGVEC